MKNVCFDTEELRSVTVGRHPWTYAPMTVAVVYYNTEMGKQVFERWFPYSDDFDDNDEDVEVMPYSGPYHGNDPYNSDPEWKPLMKYNRTTRVMSKIEE